MIMVPPDVRIKVLICPGRTYLFKAEEHDGDKKHFFVILNTDPWNQNEIVMVFATTITEKHSAEKYSKMYNEGTIVQVTSDDMPYISRPSLFNCNNCSVKTKEEIIRKLELGELSQKDIVSGAIIKKLREAFIKSKDISENYKNLVR